MPARLRRGRGNGFARQPYRSATSDKAAEENRLARDSEYLGRIYWTPWDVEVPGHGRGPQADSPPRGRGGEGQRACSASIRERPCGVQFKARGGQSLDEEGVKARQRREAPD